MDIIFIDQNKWIEFAKIEAKKDVSSEILSLYENLIDAVKQGKAIFPLTFSNIIETSKRNDPKSRLHVVFAQAQLSKGLVFKSEKSLLLFEMCNALKKFFGEQITQRPDNWVIDGFMQSNENLDSILLTDKENESLSFIIRHSNPQTLYINSMMNSNDTARREVHRKLHENSVALVEKIEQRVLNDSSHQQEFRKKTYAARLFTHYQPIFEEALQITNHTYDDLLGCGSEAFLDLIKDIPKINIEIEIVNKIEMRNSKIQTNSLYDLRSFTTTIPYCNYVVAEKDFVSIAKQAKLDKQYSTVITDSLSTLKGLYN